LEPIESRFGSSGVPRIRQLETFLNCCHRRAGSGRSRTTLRLCTSRKLRNKPSTREPLKNPTSGDLGRLRFELPFRRHPTVHSTAVRVAPSSSHQIQLPCHYNEAFCCPCSSLEPFGSARPHYDSIIRHFSFVQHINSHQMSL
jgi:hypothetical protein